MTPIVTSSSSNHLIFRGNSSCGHSSSTPAVNRSGIGWVIEEAELAMKRVNKFTTSRAGQETLCRRRESKPPRFLISTVAIQRLEAGG